MQSPIPTNRKARAQITRQMILDAAEDVFFETGLSGATLEAIAQRSNVTRGAIYWHFRNKMEVFAAIFERTISFYESLLVERMEQAASLDELEHFTVELLQSIATDPAKQRPLSILLLRHERLPQEHALLEDARISSARIVSRLAAFLERVEAAPALPKSASLLQVAEALQCYMCGLLLHFLQYPGTTDLAAHAGTYVRLFFGSLNPGAPHPTRRKR